MSRFQIPLFVALFANAITFSEPASAQVYYSTSNYSATPVTLLPAPNYVVYSPSFMAWRSAGYYAGNWGPYYYNPQALYPYIPGNAIWPNRLPAYAPVTPPLRYVYYVR
jgi:hypothetical protein